MATGLLDKANIILTPTGYKAGTMYNVAPIEQPYEDFVFSRASVASRVNSSGLVEMVGRTLGSNLVQNGDFSEIGPDLVQNGTFDLGSELVTNGDFATDSDWSKTQLGNDTIVIENGYALFNCPDNSNIFITQSSVMTIGKTYTASFDIISIDSGGFQFGSGGGGTITGSPTANTVGTHTFTFVATTASFVIKRALGSPNLLNGKIDNVSVKEVPDWRLGTGWSVENNKAIYSGTANANLSQFGILTSSKQYKLEYEVISSTLVGGIVKLSGETASAQNVLSQSVGTHTLYFTADGTSPTDLNIRVVINTAGQYEITNVVIKQLDPNDYWTLGTGWSIGDEEAICNGVGINSLQQSGITTTGKTYKLIFDVISKSNDDFLVISTNFGDTYVNGSSTIVGTNTFYINPSGGTGIRFRVANGTSLTITNVSVQEIIDTNNIPRINYDSNGENGHWLLEPTSTNLITYSEEISQYTSAGVSVIDNDTTSPSGLTNASKITETAGGSLHYVDFSLTGTANEYSWSCFLKQGTTRYAGMRAVVNGFANRFFVNVDLSNGSVVDTETVGSGVTWEYSVEEYSNGWYRLIINAPNTSGNMNLAISPSDAAQPSYSLGLPTFLGNTSNNFYVWGVQLETLSYATSYIPSLTGSTVTRASETCTNAGNSTLINSTEGVLYAEIAALDDGISQQIGVYGNSTTKQLRLEIANSVIRAQLFNGAYQANMSSTQTVTNFNKIAFKWKVNDFALWINGTEVATDSSGSTFPANDLDRLNLSGQNGISNLAQAKIKSVVVFNTALTDAELTELTS